MKYRRTLILESGSTAGTRCSGGAAVNTRSRFLCYIGIVPPLPKPFHSKLIQQPDLAARAALPEGTPLQSEAEQALAIVAPLAVTQEGQALPWLPQPGEDAQAYEAFSLWLESGAELPRVELAARWAWRERKQAFVQQGLTSLIPSEAMRKEASLRCTVALKRALFYEGAKLLAQAASNQHPTMSVRECTKALKDVVTLERLLDGLSTENVSLHLTEADPFAGLTEDEQETLLRIEMARRARLEKGA